jgi:hypothetical protein
VLPLVRNLLVKNAAVFVIEFLDLIDVVGALCYQGTFDKLISNVIEIELGSKCFDVLDELSFVNSGKRVLDSANGQHWRSRTAEGAGH